MISYTQKFMYPRFETMLTHFEACSISRPLCAMSDISDDIVSLIPDNFVFGRPVLEYAEPDHSNLSLSLANR